ncbi:MAG: hypothetical protein H7Z42_06330 [Roseiflexaceae bacterium]|nr:hypothetical protein [Roseiflexaceae bacterium]
MEQKPQSLVALFGRLAEAEAALHALQEAGVAYANISMASHEVAAVEPSVGHAVADDDGLVWSLAVLVGEPLHTKALGVLRAQPTFALGQQPAEFAGRDTVDRGRTAWGHYVFEPVAASGWVGEAAVTSGTSGIISSGALSERANVQDSPSTDKVKEQRG